jgi:hypothetical protein
MRRMALSTLVAAIVKFAVRSVLGQLKNLEKDILVASDVSPRTCNGCKSLRTKEVRPLRELVKLPVEVTQTPIFNNRGLPVFLCEFCDGYELDGALQAHQKRIDNK